MRRLRFLVPACGTHYGLEECGDYGDPLSYFRKSKFGEYQSNPAPLAVVLMHIFRT